MNKEAGDVLICSTQSFFDDDLVSLCTGCGTVVYLRPYAQLVVRRMCVTCAMPILRKQSFQIRVFEKTLEELRDRLMQKERT